MKKLKFRNDNCIYFTMEYINEKPSFVPHIIYKKHPIIFKEKYAQIPLINMKKQIVEYNKR